MLHCLIILIDYMGQIEIFKREIISLARIEQLQRIQKRGRKLCIECDIT